MRSCCPRACLRLSGLAAAAVLLCHGLTAGAQELEPRRWSHLPENFNFVGAAYAVTQAEHYPCPSVTSVVHNINADFAGASSTRPEIELAVSLAEDALAHGAEESGHHFVLATRAGRLAGYACWGPIDGTLGGFDLYWIVVDAAGQGAGLGRRLLAECEARMRARGGRLCWVETSGRRDYAPTRAFYERSGYRVEAKLADFYAPGDDKLVFVKALP